MCRDQVAKAIDDFEMIRPGERVLVAVSGGKDSLACWDILRELDYEADGFVIGLGIGEYSKDSTHHAVAFARERNLVLHMHDLRADSGFDVPTAAKVTRRVPCSACGLSKRHLFDEAARTKGYDVVATGHNLDDEAAVLFGNVLHWQTDYLGRQQPVLPARNGFPRKVKPLVRLGERETAAYCVLRGIDYIVEECPMAVGNKHIGYKEALNAIERQSPGSKHDFYFGFLKRVLLIDGKERRYLITLTDGGEFHSHTGVVPHDALIGAPEGTTFRSTRGSRFTAFRPTLSDFVLKMPRGAQVIYPKDLGPLLLLADIQVGVRVLESGVGSGALSMAMLRAGAEIVGYELRDERSLRPGGIFVAYTPTINQAAHLRETLDTGRFTLAETIEVLHRSWHIEGQSVRPDHRMVAHTGFLTAARLLAG
jgi:tRNA A58 N-methylase Trm61/tRNA(Ile)-lysidine synthase TilS/MesJ